MTDPTWQTENTMEHKHINESLTRIEKKQDKIHGILTGNGEKDCGVLGRLVHHDDRIGSLETWKIWIVGFCTAIMIALIIGAISHVFRSVTP